MPLRTMTQVTLAYFIKYKMHLKDFILICFRRPTQKVFITWVFKTLYKHHSIHGFFLLLHFYKHLMINDDNLQRGVYLKTIVVFWLQGFNLSCKLTKFIQIRAKEFYRNKTEIKGDDRMIKIYAFQMINISLYN